MKCPNCGKPYDEQETICSSCGQPLSNARYTPVTSSSRRRKEKTEQADTPASGDSPKKSRRKRRRWLLLLLIFFLLIGAGLGGYFFYINQIKERCQGAVRQIFSMAESMDFSSVDSSYLPPALQENPDIREYVDDYVRNALEEYRIDGLLERAGITIDTDALCDEIIQSASYEITGTQTTYNRCEVFVHTENTDFSALPEAIAGEVENSLSDASFWDSLQDFFSSIFSGRSHKGGEDSREHDEDEDLFASLYEDFRASAPTTETDSSIVFGIENGQWTLLSLDEDLLYSYYGLAALKTE